jgi:hypothetical protein
MYFEVKGLLLDALDQLTVLEGMSLLQRTRTYLGMGGDRVVVANMSTTNSDERRCNF